jgi:hypothetical protein
VNRKRWSCPGADDRFGESALILFHASCTVWRRNPSSVVSVCDEDHLSELHVVDQHVYLMGDAAVLRSDNKYACIMTHYAKDDKA